MTLLKEDRSRLKSLGATDANIEKIATIMKNIPDACAGDVDILLTKIFAIFQMKLDKIRESI